MRWHVNNQHVVIQFDIQTETTLVIDMLKVLACNDPLFQFELDRLIYVLGGQPNDHDETRQ